MSLLIACLLSNKRQILVGDLNQEGDIPESVKSKLSTWLFIKIPPAQNDFAALELRSGV